MKPTLDYTETSFWEFVLDNATRSEIVQYLSTRQQSVKDDFEEKWRAVFEQLLYDDIDDIGHKNWEFERDKI